MIDHIGLHVHDVAKATEFYLKALAPLGISIIKQVSAEAAGGSAHVGLRTGRGSEAAMASLTAAQRH